MSYQESQWVRKEFTERYSERADVFIVKRRRLYAMISDFFRFFHSDPKKTIRVLDIGSGDGILAEILVETGLDVVCTLIDGSVPMLDQAKERFAKRGEGAEGKHTYIVASFQEVISGSVKIEGNFDFVVSSMAIHHLTFDKKKSLYGRIYELIVNGGYFLNMDVTKSADQEFQKFYDRKWLDHMEKAVVKLGSVAKDITPSEVVARFERSGIDKPDTLESQVAALKEIGFGNCECFYKVGKFALFGGRK